MGARAISRHGKSRVRYFGNTQTSFDRRATNVTLTLTSLPTEIIQLIARHILQLDSAYPYFSSWNRLMPWALSCRGIARQLEAILHRHVTATPCAASDHAWRAVLSSLTSTSWLSSVRYLNLRWCAKHADQGVSFREGDQLFGLLSRMTGLRGLR